MVAPDAPAVWGAPWSSPVVQPQSAASVLMQVWDSLGRLLYQSAPQDHVVTAVAWSPSSDLFAVGSFNTVSLCGRSGSAFSKVWRAVHRL